jgi:hypothetical protein
MYHFENQAYWRKNLSILRIETLPQILALLTITRKRDPKKMQSIRLDFCFLLKVIKKNNTNNSDERYLYAIMVYNLSFTKSQYFYLSRHILFIFKYALGIFELY